MLTLRIRHNVVGTIKKGASVGPFQDENTSFVRTDGVIFPHRVGSHALKTNHISLLVEQEMQSRWQQLITAAA